MVKVEWNMQMGRYMMAAGCLTDIQAKVYGKEK